MPVTSTLVWLEKTEVYSTPPHLMHELSLRLNQNQHLGSFLTQHYRKRLYAFTGSQGTPFRIQISGSQGNLGNGTASLCSSFPPLFSLKARNVPYPVYRH